MSEPVQDLAATVQTLLDCACVALEDAGRPVCECSEVVGSPMVAGCCECDTGGGGEGALFASFERMYDADPATLQQVTRVRPCRSSVVVADITLLLTRCYPTIGEDGNLPDSDATTAAAEGLHADAAVLWQALSCCTRVPSYMRDVVTDSDPQAGCSMLAARVTVQISPRPPVPAGGVP